MYRINVLILISIQLFLYLLALPSSASTCQDYKLSINTASSDSFQLFDSDDLLEVEIISDFRNLRRKKYSSDYQSAELRINSNSQGSITKAIRIKARGEFRKGFCHFPPLKINFEETEFMNEDLKELESIKFVSNCKSGRIYQGYVLKEYLAYKLYQKMTTKSFRTRLIKVKYVDTGRKGASHESHGFIIEDVAKMAARNGSLPTNNLRLTQRLLSSGDITLVALFQFMIGNTDWSVSGQHNVKTIRERDFNGSTYVVPYDFDYSGLVNTSYAIPHEHLGIKTVRERLYRGKCVEEEVMEPIRQAFIAKKSALFAIVAQFSLIEERERRDCLTYLSSFFDLIERKKRFYLAINRDCF